MGMHAQWSWTDKTELTNANKTRPPGIVVPKAPLGCQGEYRIILIEIAGHNGAEGNHGCVSSKVMRRYAKGYEGLYNKL